MDGGPAAEEHIEYFRHSPEGVNQRLSHSDEIEAAALFGVPPVHPIDIRIVVPAGPFFILENPIRKDAAKSQVEVVRQHLPLARPFAVAIEVKVFVIAAILVLDQ